MAEKTEEPTPKRLQDARRKGQIPFSQDIPAAAGFLAGMLVVALWAPKVAEEFRALFEAVTRVIPRIEGGVADTAWTGPAWRAGLALAWSAGPMLAGVTLAGVALALAQAGFNLSFERVKPSLTKLNPIQGLKRWFSIAGFVELGKTLVKVAIVLLVGYWAVSGAFRGILGLHRAELVPFYEVLAHVVRSFVLQAGAAFVLVAAFDYYFQWRKWKKGLMMTKDEVKQEYKEQEGDPIVKSQRKALHQELAMQQIAAEVPLADALVVNPVHLAVAVRYDRDKMAAPRVTAKGGGVLARRMRELARKHDIPIIRDVPLARALFAVEMGRYIPRDLYEAVAEVLLFASQLRQEASRDRTVVGRV